MAQRNYPCDNFIYVYFGKEGQNFNVTGEMNFKKRMSQNTFGIIVWQYNEIWPTGGWGSIEYGNPHFPGQVIGGRWKPLQYWYRKSLFTDIVSTCGQDGWCYVR